MADEQLSLILVTAPSLEVANQLARGLVTEHPAACVNVLPQVMSTYVWEGQLASRRSPDDDQNSPLAVCRTGAVHSRASSV